jgi:hypothetical protein
VCSEECCGWDVFDGFRPKATQSRFSILFLNHPETEIEAVRNLAWRVAERLVNDLEQPPRSFSFGVASYPKDGRTFDQVLGKADRALLRHETRAYPGKLFLGVNNDGTVQHPDKSARV